MSNSQPHYNRGFTIIETMFVIAIGGIIMLLVARALPALQQSGRNNQRKQDVAAILNGISRFESNNSGDYPTDAEKDTIVNALSLTILKNTVDSSGDDFIHLEPSPTDAERQDRLLHNPTITARLNPRYAQIYNYYRCDSTNSGATVQGAGYRDVVVLYALESGDNIVGHCRQL